MSQPVIIDGKVVAKEIRSQLKARIKKLGEAGIVPGLAAVLVGDDPASHTYVSSKERACERLKLHSQIIKRPAETSQEELVRIVKDLNEDDRIHGILVQSPLPDHMDELTVTLTIDPAKDVDGFHPHNVGLMMLGRPCLLPCTPHGVVKLLEHYEIDPEGREVVIVGRSNIVGKPLGVMLQQKQKGANATVTIAHSRSRDLAGICKRADILIAAIGRPATITGDMVKPRAVVIDVGVNRVDDPTTEKGYRLVGDVDFESVVSRASYITPVPGGVGPMTIAMLLVNTVTAAEQITGSN